MIRVAVIGCGYWGPNYMRVFTELRDTKVVACCDLDERNFRKIKNQYSDVRFSTRCEEVAKSPSVDAVVITTPLNTHYALARLFLDHGKHVLVEKPFAASSAEVCDLMAIAERKRLVLVGGHVYEFNPGLRKLKEMISRGRLGTIYSVYSERVGLGPIRKHANVLWDLATHDISIALHLLDEFPETVTATGESYVQRKIHDVIFMSLKFPSRVIYNIYASWIAPEKVRKTSVVGSKGMAVFDDVDKSETLKIYQRKIDNKLLDSTPNYSDHQLVVTMGDVYIPKVEPREPLKDMAKYFLDCIRGKKKPTSDGLKIVKILEAGQKSLDRKKTVACC